MCYLSVCQIPLWERVSGFFLPCQIILCLKKINFLQMFAIHEDESEYDDIFLRGMDRGGDRLRDTKRIFCYDHAFLLASLGRCGIICCKPESLSFYILFFLIS